MLLRDDRELENGFLARAVGGDDAVTFETPTVSVPVLSSTTISILFSCSR
jgi:hypothetical protein